MWVSPTGGLTLRIVIPTHPTHVTGVICQTPRTEWVLQWPGQVVIAGCQTHWTKEVSEALLENKIDELYKALMAQVRSSSFVGAQNAFTVEENSIFNCWYDADT